MTKTTTAHLEATELTLMDLETNDKFVIPYDNGRRVHGKLIVKANEMSALVKLYNVYSFDKDGNELSTNQTIRISSETVIEREED